MSGGKILQEMTATEVRDHLAAGHSDVASFYDQQLAFAQGVQERVQAFADLDERVIRLQAGHRKDERARGEPLGRLYGVPVAVKDIIDTIDFPTALGSPIHAGRYAVADATVVRRLRDAGAVIFGKTVTTEFATFHPGPTRNPHNLEHTPGGSSSGSAAAVAAGVVPVAIGTQTNGSLIRPASFCGVYGYKPSRGLLPRTGVFEQSPSLDQIGVFARCVEDLALVAEIMAGDDGHDHATLGQPPRQLMSVCCSAPPIEPKFCFVRTPWWDQVDPEARAAYEAFVELMRGVVVMSDLPAVVEQAIKWHEHVNEAELAFALQREYRNHPAQLSDALRKRVEQGMQMPVLDYLAAKDRIPHVASAFDEYFEHYDAILLPAALGGAPRGLASTGNPIMQTVWSFAGLPTVSMPLLNLSNGLPLGVQAAGALHNDGRLLRAIRWLVNEFVTRGYS
ncbi:MAG: amidase [Burkholderiaceae bacterium]|nr:amidase [Burkholderiaceae bacterium]